jgi:hypothetical protein
MWRWLAYSLAAVVDVVVVVGHVEDPDAVATLFENWKYHLSPPHDQRSKRDEVV